jgi:tetratricopeptide (TPR) repeat protein
VADPAEDLAEDLAVDLPADLTAGAQRPAEADDADDADESVVVDEVVAAADVDTDEDEDQDEEQDEDDVDDDEDEDDVDEDVDDDVDEDEDDLVEDQVAAADVDSDDVDAEDVDDEDDEDDEDEETGDGDGERIEERSPDGEPELPEDIDPRDLDPEVRSELRTLTGQLNTLVSKRLVASGLLLDEDPAGALAHAMVARRLAPRVASVREAVGLAAYHTGQWAMAVAELRTYHRITGRQTHLSVIADCERAQGRPEKAVDLYRAANLDKLEPDEAIELLIVASGARGDLGQTDAAVAMLQVPDLQDDDAPWAARLRYAYADSLLAAGRTDDARLWFARSADVDEDFATDAAERLLELDGVVIDDPADPAGATTGNGSDDGTKSDPHVRHTLVFTEPPQAADGPDR